ncbi:MAG TPA: hypothetical protein VK736_12470 [Candidatus Binatia bacterium]|nr:hypothetical protein [Candidatus Binatia bacterium]
MSAYMVSKAHIDAMLTAGLARDQYGPLRWWVDDEPRSRDNMQELTYQTADRVGAMLLAENRRSVNYRYDENEPVPAYEFNRLPGYNHKEHAVLVLKAIHGFDYQACECDDWWRTEARAFCVALSRHLESELPGYEDAPTWGIDDPNVFLTYDELSC